MLILLVAVAVHGKREPPLGGRHGRLQARGGAGWLASMRKRFPPAKKK